MLLACNHIGCWGKNVSASQRTFHFSWCLNALSFNKVQTTNTARTSCDESRTLWCCLKSLVSGPKFALEYSAKISTNGQQANIFCTCLWNKAQKLIRRKLNNGLTLAKTKHWLGVSQPSLMAPTVLCITMFIINSQCTFSFLLNILMWVSKKVSFFF